MFQQGRGVSVRRKRWPRGCGRSPEVTRGAHGVTRRVSGRIELSYLELIAVVTLIAILLAVAVSRLWRLPSIAEHVAMDSVIGGIQSGIGMKVAELIADNEVRDLKPLAARNPMEFLAQVPRNYVGVRAGPYGVQPGQWYFNANDGYLVYRVRDSGVFETALPGPKRARFRIRVVYEQEAGSGARQVAGLRLQAVEPYRWRR